MATYFVKTGGSDAADGLSDGNAWETIAKVNAQTFSAGDIIQFNKGDTWNETLIPPSSGSSGSPITFQAYGTGANPAMIGSIAAGGASALTNAGRLIGKDWVSFDSVDFRGSDGSSAGDHVFKLEDSDNITFNSCFIGGPNDEEVAAPFMAALMVLGTSDTLTCTDCTFTLAVSSQYFWVSTGGNSSFTNCTFTGGDGTTWGKLSCALVDNVAGNNHIFDGCTFDGATASARQLLDFKAATGNEVKNCTFSPTNQLGEHLSITGGNGTGTPTVVTVEDCTFNDAAVGIDDESTGTFRRCNFVHTTTGVGRLVRTGATTTRGDSSVAVFDSCSFKVESSSGLDEMIDPWRGNITMDNCTLVMRNGTTSGVNLIDLNATFAGAMTIRNSIITGNLPLFDEPAGSTATFVFENNLWERTDQTTGWFNFDDETACTDESDVGVTAPLDDASNISGDPLFASEDEASAFYLRVDPVNSPAVGAGNSSYGGSTDLNGIPYGSPKNIGCRSNSIRHKRTMLRQMMAV